MTTVGREEAFKWLLENVSKYIPDIDILPKGNIKKIEYYDHRQLIECWVK